MDFKKFFGSIGGIAILHFLIMCVCRAGLVIAGCNLGDPIYTVVGQPARVLWHDVFKVGNGTAWFWIISIICSVIWGAVISTCLVKFFQKKS